MRRGSAGNNQIHLSPAQLDLGFATHPKMPSPPHDLEIVPWEAIAGLRFEPRELEARLGIQFQDSVDDLDTLRLAVLVLPGGIRVSLVRHVHSPSSGTELHIDPAQFARQDNLARDYFGTVDRIQQSVLPRIIAGLALTPDDITWTQGRQSY